MRENKCTSFVLVHPYSICTVLMYRPIDLVKKNPIIICKQMLQNAHNRYTPRNGGHVGLYLLPALVFDSFENCPVQRFYFCFLYGSDN